MITSRTKLDDIAYKLYMNRIDFDSVYNSINKNEFKDILYDKKFDADYYNKERNAIKSFYYKANIILRKEKLIEIFKIENDKS